MDSLLPFPLYKELLLKKLAKLFPAGGNFWRLLCNKSETGCGWIETERSPFFQGHTSHSLRSTSSTSPLTHLIRDPYREKEGWGHLRAFRPLFVCLYPTDKFQSSNIDPNGIIRANLNFRCIHAWHLLLQVTEMTFYGIFFCRMFT